MLLSTVFALAPADFGCIYVSDGVKSAQKMRFLRLYLPLNCDFWATRLSLAALNGTNAAIIGYIGHVLRLFIAFYSSNTA